MFTKIFTLSTLAVAVLATYVPPTDPAGIANSCNADSVYCCNSIQSSQDPSLTTLIAAVGAAIDDITVQVGLDCTPVDVIALGGNSCSAQAACCDRNNFNSALTVGCTPLNINT